MVYNAGAMPEPTTCSKCSKPEDRRPLTKCPICHKMVCDDCRYNVSGRWFCSSHCADFFFFEDEEA